MKLSERRINYLLEVHIEGIATKEEEQELRDWVVEAPDDERIDERIEDLLRSPKWNVGAEINWKATYDAIWDKIETREQLKSNKIRVWSSLKIAVVLLAFVIGGWSVYSLIKNRAEQEDAVVRLENEESLPEAYKNDIKPGSRHAVLKAGRNSVSLTNQDTSFVLGGNKVSISKKNVYVEEVKPVEYTLSVPSGSTYTLNLSDGTKVWLNAESELTYPSFFTGSTRAVQLEGEAYFEVVTDAKHPFVVQTDRQKVDVLGTAFNVRAYMGETQATTLINGKVVVRDEDERMVLSPGQQVLIDDSKRLILKENTDVNQVTAWKEGYFRFNKMSIEEIMNILSRWYPIEVDYANGKSNKLFGAIINRDNNISRILSMLEATGDVHFKIDGTKVTVL